MILSLKNNKVVVLGYLFKVPRSTIIQQLKIYEIAPAKKPVTIYFSVMLFNREKIDFYNSYF